MSSRILQKYSAFPKCGAFYGVGDITNAIAGVDPSAAHIQPEFGTDAYAFNVAGHALVGCGSSVASGGSCGSGALAGGVSAAAGPLINTSNRVASLTANAEVGGLASVAGGGKFANGAVTGAFGYLFDAAAGRAIGSGALGTLVAVAGAETGPFDLLLAAAAHYAGGGIGSWIEDKLFGSADYTAVIGRTNDLYSLAQGERSLLNRLPDQEAHKTIGIRIRVCYGRR